MALLPSIKTLLIRLASALAAILIVALLFHFFGKDSIRVLSLFAVIAGGGEVIKLLFKPEDPKSLKILLYVLFLAVFTTSSAQFADAASSFCIAIIIIICLSLFSTNRFVDLSALLMFQSKAILAMFYIGLLPSFVFKLFYLEHGLTWFFLILSIVFAGDTAAYAFGVLFGKRKIMPRVSPQKTVSGAVGGLLGTISVSIGFGYFMDKDRIGAFVLLGLLTGVTAQLGDLFESLIKRVADQKDSGAIMPGHGGVLDRIDGVLFAAPIVYAFATWFLAN